MKQTEVLGAIRRGVKTGGGVQGMRRWDMAGDGEDRGRNRSRAGAGWQSKEAGDTGRLGQK